MSQRMQAYETHDARNSAKTRPLRAIEAINPHFALALHHPTPASESYFPQEARGFVQLNSFPHPLH